MKRLVYIFIVFLSFGLGWCARSPNEQSTEKADTVTMETTKTMIVCDTLFVPYPMPYISQFTGDSIEIGGTLQPKEQKVYKDSNYTAWVSGVHPTLDSIAIYPKTVTITNDIYHTITKYKQPSRLSLGVIAGYGIGKNGLSPYLGLGLSYRIW